MKKSTFDNEPLLVADEAEQVRVSFGVEKVKELFPSLDDKEPVEREVYKAYVVRVDKPVTRGNVIDKIVSEKYPNDVMQAVINNHLMEKPSAEHEQEFNDMQAWRQMAKTIADDVMEEIA